MSKLARSVAGWKGRLENNDLCSAAWDVDVIEEFFPVLPRPRAGMDVPFCFPGLEIWGQSG